MQNAKLTPLTAAVQISNTLSDSAKIMIKKLFAAALFCALMFTFSFQAAAKANRAAHYPFIRNERLLQTALREIYDAQNIYQETVGDGNFGTFDSLVDAGLLSSTWTNAYCKYGYCFQMFTNARILGSSYGATFYISTVPLKYRRTGRRSFYVDYLGVMRAGDKNGATASGDEPIIENFPYTPLKVRSDSRIIRTMRTIHNAQITYQATTGSGNFGTISQLHIQGMRGNTSGDCYFGGYDFILTKINFTSTSPAYYKVTATPSQYNVTGVRSFYIDETGNLRGADRNGTPATASDPVVENECLQNEDCTIANLRTLHSAEATYQATSGNGDFGTLNQLAAVSLVNELLARGYANGYNFTITLIARTNSSPASFSISAVPINYGVTGFRSFYIDESGVIRGADKQGAPATANDPVVE